MNEESLHLESDFTKYQIIDHILYCHCYDLILNCCEERKVFFEWEDCFILDRGVYAFYIDFEVTYFS